MPPRRRNRNGNSITYSTSSSNGSQPLFSQSSTHSSFIDEDSMNNVLQQVGQIFSSIIWYIWALLRGALMMLRPFFSIILAFGILVILFGILTNSLSIIKSVIHIRVCRLPLVPILLTCPSSGSDAFDSTMGHVPNFADLIKKQEASYQIIADSLSTLNPNFVYKKVVGKTRKRDKFKKFIMGDRANKDDGNHDDDDEDEDDPYGLAENSRERLPLPLLLKRAELAVVDLKVLVKHSGLPEMSKDLLVEQLEAFHTGAKTTGRQIQFLQARAHGCLDGLVIRNTYLIMELDRLEKKQLLLETNRDNAGIWDKMLDTLLMSNEVQLVVSEKKLNQLYQKTMAEARNHLRDLIFKAQEVLQSLNELDTILSTINEIVIQESSQQNRKHEDTLAQIWTIFGINRLEIEYYRENLALLRELEGQRKAAVGQIQSAVWKLTDFEAEFGILREKIVDGIVSSSEDGGPPVIEGPNESKSGLGEVATMPLKVHIQQIELVTNRLKDRSFLSNTKAKDKVKDPKEDNPEPSAAA